MDNYLLTSLILVISASIGGLAGLAHLSELENNNLNQPSEAHEHALFHVVRNGSEVDFRKEKFQLNAREVHLENNISDIVHKHRSGITWSQFLETIDVETWESNSTGNLCVSIAEDTMCSGGKIILNGEEVESLDKVIEQDDHLLIIQDTGNMTELTDEYMKQQLPPEYKPESIRGRQV